MGKYRASTIFSFVRIGWVGALSHNKDSAPLSSNQVNYIVDPVLYNQKIGNYQIGDPFIIEKHEIKRNKLMLNLSFGGRNRKRNFEVLWDGSFFKYNPCQIQVIIVHHSNITKSEAYINQELEFDIEKLMGSSYNESIKLRIVNAYDGSILN